MPTVREILARKGNNVVSVDPSTTVLDAAQVMNARGIGAVVVLTDGQLVGIFTERDIMRRVVAAGRSPSETPVRDVMTTSPITTRADMPIDECASLMTTRRIRHLPVRGAEGLAGIITTGDLMAFQVAEQAVTIAHLNSYLYDNR